LVFQDNKAFVADLRQQKGQMTFVREAAKLPHGKFKQNVNVAKRIAVRF
jgi:hypothetical protein